MFSLKEKILLERSKKNLVTIEISYKSHIHISIFQNNLSLSNDNKLFEKFGLPRAHRVLRMGQ